MEYAPSKKYSDHNKIAVNDCMILTQICSHLRGHNIYLAPTRHCWAPDSHPCQRHGGNTGIYPKSEILRWKGWLLQVLPCRPIVGRWCNLPPHSWIQPHLRRPSGKRWCLGLATNKQVETLNVTTSSIWDLKWPKKTTRKLPLDCHLQSAWDDE